MLNGNFAESLQPFIRFEEDSTLALNYVLEVIYSKLIACDVSEILPEDNEELDCLLDKYELTGVRAHWNQWREGVQEISRLGNQVIMLDAYVIKMKDCMNEMEKKHQQGRYSLSHSSSQVPSNKYLLMQH